MELRLILSCGWIRAAAVASPGGWVQVTTESSSGGWIRVAADSVPQLTRVPVTGYELQLIHPGADYELWLTLYCD